MAWFKCVFVLQEIRTVNPVIFAGILFSRIALQHILAALKITTSA